MALENKNELLITFCDYIHNEAFGDGLIWAKSRLEKLYNGQLPFEIDVESEPQFQNQAQLEQSPEGILLYYCGCYLAARVLVENSYLYVRAQSFITCAQGVLNLLESSNTTTVLYHFADIQNAVCAVDRAVYTSQEVMMLQAVQNIKDNLAEVDAINCTDLGLPYFDQVFHSYALYTQAIDIIARLNSERWQPVSYFKQLVEQERQQFKDIIAALESNNDYILSTDLAAQWPALEQFAERPDTLSGELIVENGTVSISYFATLNHHLMDQFKRRLEENVQCETDCPLNLKSWGAAPPQPSEMSDIWSGLADYEFIDTYFWQLPELTIPFRVEQTQTCNLVFDVELTYYSMGIFALNLRSPIENFSASAVRHAITIGTPFATEQKISWNNQKFGLLSSFVAAQFDSLNKILSSVLDWSNEREHDPIRYQIHDNRFVMLRTDKVKVKEGQSERLLNAQELREHFAFSAFSIPQREARCAIDDWCLRDREQNSLPELSGYYNKNEVLMVSQHEALLALTEQPNWSRETAEEVVLTAAIITNLFQLSNIVLSQMLKSSIKDEVANLNGEELKTKALKKRIAEYEKEKESLEKFSQDAQWLLDVIEAGGMTTYPDHTKMMDEIFTHLNFENQYYRTKQTLLQINKLQDNIIHEISKIYNRMSSRVSKHVNRILSAAMALISIGALKDVFDIFNDADFGMTISGKTQLGVIGGIGLVLILVFIFNKESNS